MFFAVPGSLVHSCVALLEMHEINTEVILKVYFVKFIQRLILILQCRGHGIMSLIPQMMFNNVI